MKFFIFLFTFFISFSQLLLADTPKDQSGKRPEVILRKDKISCKEALKKLMDGNERFVKNQVSYADSSEERREAISAVQDPFAVILGCSDSRVSTEIVFDQGLGELFVIRTAGNAAGPDELDSIEFAVKNLNTSIVMVLGHQNCGAISAILTDKGSEIPEIAKFLINPNVPQCANLNSCVKANVKHSIQIIKNSPIVNPYIKRGEIAIVGAYYDMDSGKVEILDES